MSKKNLGEMDSINLFNENYVEKSFWDLLEKRPNIKKYHLDRGQYRDFYNEKIAVFLHHTAGTTWKGAWNWWNQTPEKIGTPYIIGREGLIVEAFDPRSWAYHLGVSGDDNFLEWKSVPIEIVSAGPLRGENNNMFYPLWPNKEASKEIPKEEIVTLNKKFRNFKHFHKYTDHQILSICQLILKIKQDFPSVEIPKPLGNFWEYDYSVVKETKPGLWSHTTVRDDKIDIFPQPNLIKALEFTSEYININSSSREK